MGALASQPAHHDGELLFAELTDLADLADLASVPLPPRTPQRGLCWADLGAPRLLSGCGGSCDVFAATLAGEHVAVKVPKPAFAEGGAVEIAREAALLVQLSHRNIVRLLGVGEASDGRPFLVLELLAHTLADELPRPLASLCGEARDDECGICERFASVRRWPMRRALRCGYQLALALRHLHAEPLAGRRVLHRDIKPDNVGFLPNGALVLLDFGLATACDLAAAAGVEPCRLTGQTGACRYMAPEVALCRPYDHKAEVFSFATLLWQCAALEPPYRSLAEADFERRVARGGERPPLPPHWPALLRELLADCWREAPAERPPMNEVVRRLEVLCGSGGGVP